MRIKMVSCCCIFLSYTFLHIFIVISLATFMKVAKLSNCFKDAVASFYFFVQKYALIF